MAKYIANQISNVNEIPEESVIYVNENFFTLITIILQVAIYLEKTILIILKCSYPFI